MKLKTLLNQDGGSEYLDDLMSVIHSDEFCEAYDRADFTEMGALISRHIDAGMESAEADQLDHYEPAANDAAEIREAVSEMRRAFK